MGIDSGPGVSIKASVPSVPSVDGSGLAGFGGLMLTLMPFSLASWKKLLGVTPWPRALRQLLYWVSASCVL